MSWSQTTITLKPRSRGFHLIDNDILTKLPQLSQLKIGLLHLFIQHTSASLTINENADPTVRSDLDRFFARLVPDGDRIFEHTFEGEDDMPAHVRTALTAVNLSIPVVSGALALGTWQGIYLWEHRTHPHRRRVVVHILGE